MALQASGGGLALLALFPVFTVNLPFALVVGLLITNQVMITNFLDSLVKRKPVSHISEGLRLP